MTSAEEIAQAARNGDDVLLRVEDIHTFYGSIEALKGITIEVRAGEIVTLIGSNGAGKSTTLRSISGIVPPKTGHISFQGVEITGLPVILSSGYAGEALAGVEEAPWPLLRKPYTSEELSRMLQAVRQPVAETQ